VGERARGLETPALPPYTPSPNPFLKGVGRGLWGEAGGLPPGPPPFFEKKAHITTADSTARRSSPVQWTD